MPNLRVKDATYRELFKLKSLAELQAEREVHYDELLQNMIGLYQQLVRDGKITWRPRRGKQKAFLPQEATISVER